MARITHNLKLIIISIFLSLSLVYIIKHPEFFVSSVLNIQEIEEIQQKQRDIAYKTDNQMLDIFLPLSGFQDNTISQSQINISLAYNPDEIQVHTQDAVAQVPYTSTETESGYMILHFTDVSSIDPNQSLFYVPFSGTSQHILIEYASSVLDTKETSLSVGKLSRNTVHGN